MHRVAFDVHVDDVPVLYCSNLGVLRSTSLKHMMSSDQEGGLLVAVDGPMPLHDGHKRL